MKTCTHCNTEQPTENFSWKDKANGRRSAICKSCHSIKRKRYYLDNRKTERSRIVARKAEIKEWYREYKSTLSCVRCGQDHPATLQFHHPDSDDKEFEVSRAVTDGHSIESILSEINKCEVLCANCHSIEHWDSKYS